MLNKKSSDASSAGEPAGSLKRAGSAWVETSKQSPPIGRLVLARIENGVTVARLKEIRGKREWTTTMRIRCPENRASHWCEIPPFDAMPNNGAKP